MELTPAPERLYALLPYVHRLRDAETGEPLRQLLQVIGEQVGVLEDDISQLYENWFIETAEPWAVPYIAALIGYTPVSEAGPPADQLDERGLARNAVLIPRREVANTLAFRRRKGSLAVLEELSNAVAGWPARAVEFYRLLGWAPHIGRDFGAGPSSSGLNGHRFADLRDQLAMQSIESPFDSVGHSVDTRRVNSAHTRGRYNIPSIGVFSWRLRPYRVTSTPAKRLDEFGEQCFSFSAIGHDTQLFTRPDPEASATSIAGPLNVPAPIGRQAFEQRSADHPPVANASPSYYGDDRSLIITVSGWPTRDESGPIPSTQVIPTDLSDWERYQARPGTVGVDPVLGRMIFPPAQTPRHVRVTYHYAFSADLGGGEYDRLQPTRSARALSLFSRRDLLEVSGLLDALQSRQGELATYLASAWSPDHAELLAARAPGSDPDDALMDALVDEMNLVLDDTGLFTPERFPVGSGAGLISDDLSTLAQAGTAPTVRVNRRLLEQALSAHVALSYERFVVNGDPTAETSPLWPSEQMPSLDDALARWRLVAPSNGVVELASSDLYSLDAQLPDDRDWLIEVGPDQRLALVAGQHSRPVVTIDSADSLAVSMAGSSELVIDGLLIAEGSIDVHGPGDSSGAGSCDDRPRLVIRHSTLVPGWALSCECEPKRPANPSLELVDFGGVVTISHSIVGAIRIDHSSASAEPIELRAADSIIDATRSDRNAIAPSGPTVALATLWLARVTVLGEVHTHAIELGEDTIFYGTVQVARRQRGCLRFCSVTLPSRTPRRYHCQPDLAEADAAAAVDDPTLPKAENDARKAAARAFADLRVRPQFNSTRYGRHDYCQLSAGCASEITRGADDESEMGAFHDLYQPQRFANLSARLAEFTPAGMDAAVILAT